MQSSKQLYQLYEKKRGEVRAKIESEPHNWSGSSENMPCRQLPVSAVAVNLKTLWNDNYFILLLKAQITQDKKLKRR